MSALRDFQNQIAELQAKERENAKARNIAAIEKEKERKPIKAKEKSKTYEAGSNGAAETQDRVADNTGVDFRLQVWLFSFMCCLTF
jgi:hypothetical protein